jgi:uncharacterized protein YbjT (DUF2867 family)
LSTSAWSSDRVRRHEPFHEGERLLGDLAPPAVDRERVPAVGDLDDLGHGLVTALLHLGGVRFPITGPLRYTMAAREAVELCTLIWPRTVITLAAR